MKPVRTYAPVMSKDGCSFTRKDTYITNEKEHFDNLWENDRRGFENELRYILNLYDRPSRFDGDTYMRYEFYLTSPGRITIVYHGGYDV